MKDINIVATRLIKIQNIVFSADQVQIIRAMETAMDKFKVYNKHSRRAILSIIGKESGFKLSSELSYRNTPTDRIRLIFGYKVAKYNDIQLHELKKNDYNFFNAIYGGQYGNAPNEGFKYRGRGLNQLTFKANYVRMQTYIGADPDIIKTPDLLLDNIDVAADVCVAYFVDRFKTKPSNVKNMDDMDNFDDALISIFRANAGWGKTITDSFHQTSLNKARVYSSYFIY